MSRGVRLIGQDHTWSAHMSQSQREQARSQILPAPVPFRLTTRGRILAELRSASAAEWLGLLAIVALVVVMVLL